ncbi:MAG: hypothetical protein U0694_06025 [Anaerolineae bacterium]
MRTHSLKHFLALIIVLLVMTWLGARNLNADGVWYDEWWSLYNAGAGWFGAPLSPADIWNRLAEEDPWQLPGYPWALSAWGNSVGWTEYSARALSLLAGVLATAVTYRLGCEVSRQRIVGLGAAAALGGSTWLIYYLHEIRGYTLIVLLAALLLLLYWRMTRRKPTPLTYAAFLLALVALLYIHYFAAFFVAVLGLWHLLRLRVGLRDRHWWLTLACFALAGASLLPFVANVLYATSVTQTQQRAVIDPAHLLAIAGDMFYTFSNTGAALLVVLAFFSLRARASWRFWAFAALLLALDMFGFYVLKVNEIRYAMAILPLFALIAGFGVYELSKLRLPPALLISIWLISAVAVDQNYAVRSILNRTQPQPFREMAQILLPRLSEGDVVLNVVGVGSESSHALHPLTQYFGSSPARIEVLEIQYRPNVQNYVARVEEAVGAAQRVWITYDPRHISTEWSLLTYWLNEHHIAQCATITDQQDLLILAFGRLTDGAPQYTFGQDGIQVQPIGAIGTQDDVLQVWLGFNVSSQIPANTYSVALHLLDSSGQLRAQADYALAPAGESCHLVEIPLTDLPPDSYTLHAAVYNWQTGERLPAITPDSMTSDSPTLATLER